MADPQMHPLTYDGADMLEFLSCIDPGAIGYERLVRSLCQASAGVDGAKAMTLAFVAHCLHQAGREPFELDECVATWWEEATPADDLQQIAREEAERYRDLAFDFRLSDNHPDRIELAARQWEGLADELTAWADRPRRDALERCRVEAAEEPWPVKIVFEQKHGAKNARLFLARRPAPIISSSGTLFSFDSGAWAEMSDDMLAAEVRETDPTDFLDVDHVAKIVKGVHQIAVVSASPFEWLEPDGSEPDPEDLVLFRNGLLNVMTGKLIPHDGRYFATGLPDHDYEPFAECPTWMRWLDETLDPSFHPALQEWFGYCLTPDICAHHFMNFMGVTRSGKSTAHNVLRDLIGRQHATSAMMPDLGSDFGMQSFLDKRLVIVPDAHDTPTRNRAAALERIKSITGGDEVSVNRKNLSIVNATLRVRIVITSNRQPKFIDESGALAARMLIIRFERTFRGHEDRHMGEKLRAELSGIANWAIGGLLRLRSNGFQFTVGELGRAEVDDAARSQSPALRFAEARLTVTGNDADFVPMSVVYPAYRDWAYKEGLSRAEIRNQTDLAHDIRAGVRGVKSTQRRREAKRVYGLSGVSAVVPNLED
ncbi:MAG: phage/plasmid primase, P4 family [Pseudomonadota bacterium]